MLNTALKFLDTIEKNGFSAYIVGGFVRDYVLGIESNDIDVCTNARPSDIKKIFANCCLPNEDYGSVTVYIKKVRFEVTTFRRENVYENNRRPVDFEYIDDLLEDLKRRDFTINTLCMNKDKEIIDLLDGRKDITGMLIDTVGDSYHKFSQDALRILRAIRFATILDFKLSDNVKDAIIKTKHLLKNLSYERKKEELNKIFSSVHVRYGVKLLIELGLDKELELYNLKNITFFDDLMGIWALLDVTHIYPFSKNEISIIIDIQNVLTQDNLDPLVLYKYDLYVNSVAGAIKNIDKKLITSKYNNLKIHSRNEIVVNGKDIANCLKKQPGKYIREILDDIEEKIVCGTLDNDKDKILDYVFNKYKDISIDIM